MWVILSMVLTAIIVGGGVYIMQQNSLHKMEDKLQSQINALQAELNKKTGQATTPEPTTTTTPSSTTPSTTPSIYVGWKTLMNTDNGYSLQYPSDWTYVSRSEVGLTDPTYTAKYYEFRSPDNKYMFTFGLKHSDDQKTYLMQRTGIGGGDIVKGGSITLGAYTLSSQELVYQGKTKEVFIPTSNPYKDYANVNGYDVYIDFAFGQAFDPSVDLKQTDEYKTFLKILQSFAFDVQ